MSKVSTPLTDHLNGGISGVHAISQRVTFNIAILAKRISTETGLYLVAHCYCAKMRRSSFSTVDADYLRDKDSLDDEIVAQQPNEPIMMK